MITRRGHSGVSPWQAKKKDGFSQGLSFGLSGSLFQNAKAGAEQ
jgi:hypothetical protein